MAAGGSIKLLRHDARAVKLRIGGGPGSITLRTPLTGRPSSCGLAAGRFDYTRRSAPPARYCRCGLAGAGIDYTRIRRGQDLKMLRIGAGGIDTHPVRALRALQSLRIGGGPGSITLRRRTISPTNVEDWRRAGSITLNAPKIGASSTCGLASAGIDYINICRYGNDFGADGGGPGIDTLKEGLTSARQLRIGGGGIDYTSAVAANAPVVAVGGGRDHYTHRWLQHLSFPVADWRRAGSIHYLPHRWTRECCGLRGRVDYTHLTHGTARFVADWRRAGSIPPPAGGNRRAKCDWRRARNRFH